MGIDDICLVPSSSHFSAVTLRLYEGKRANKFDTSIQGNNTWNKTIKEIGFKKKHTVKKTNTNQIVFKFRV